MIVLVYCIVSLFNCMLCLCCSQPLRGILHTLMAHGALLFVSVASLSITNMQLIELQLHLSISSNHSHTVGLYVCDSWSSSLDCLSRGSQWCQPVMWWARAAFAVGVRSVFCIHTRWVERFAYFLMMLACLSVDLSAITLMLQCLFSASRPLTLCLFIHRVDFMSCRLPTAILLVCDNEWLWDIFNVIC